MIGDRGRTPRTEVSAAVNVTPVPLGGRSVRVLTNENGARVVVDGAAAATAAARSAWLTYPTSAAEHTDSDQDEIGNVHGRHPRAWLGGM